MKVISIRPRGYCKGVVKAIKAVEEAVGNPLIKKPIYVLGYIVHNKHVIDDLTKLGVITLDDRKSSRLELLEDIDEGTIVLSAHGTDPRVIQRLKEKQLDYIDATCEDVEVTFKLIRDYQAKGYHIFYIGKNRHPEAVAALSLAEKIDLIEKVEDIPSGIIDPIFVTNQTTFSSFEINALIDAIIQRYPKTIVSEEICNATRLRQSAIIKYNKDVDFCYIVGDTRSNNSKNLAYISETITKTPTKLIDSVAGINLDDLKQKRVVSVSSGASTPDYLTQEVIDFLKNLTLGK